jgi:hypothetical protein
MEIASFYIHFVADVVEKDLDMHEKSMVHPDVLNFWALYIQVTVASQKTVVFTYSKYVLVQIYPVLSSL